MTNLITSITGLVICLLGFLQILINRFHEKRTRKYILCFFAVLIVYVASDLISQIGDMNTGRGWYLTAKIGLFISSLSSAMLIPLLTSFLLYSCGEGNGRRNPAFLINASLLVIYTGLLIYTQFSKTIYYYDDQAVYHRGPWYPVLLIPPVLMMVVNAILLIVKRRQLTKGQMVAFATYILLPAISIIIQMFFYGYYIIILGSSIAAFLMMTHVVNDQTEQYYRQKMELANMKNEILLSQIQPHFVINTLGAIAHLCDDAPEAREAIMTFSRYIRGNIDVLLKESLIPFNKEVEHTNLYLQLEKLRFGDNLQVEMNLKARNFLIPTLTLQPLVENAVRHGVRGNPDGKGTVWITSRETEQGYEVSVTDNGPGFDPEKIREDGRNHVGLENVRERIRMIAGGELKIESEPGVGTTVTILLQRRTAKE